LLDDRALGCAAQLLYVASDKGRLEWDLLALEALQLGQPIFGSNYIRAHGPTATEGHRQPATVLAELTFYFLQGESRSRCCRPPLAGEMTKER
jgi:hypothetical protein